MYWFRTKIMESLNLSTWSKFINLIPDGSENYEISSDNNAGKQLVSKSSRAASVIVTNHELFCCCYVPFLRTLSSSNTCSHFGQILVLFVFDGPAIGSSNAVFCELSSPLINSSRLFKLSICGTNCAPSFALEHVEVLLWRSEWTIVNCSPFLR